MSTADASRSSVDPVDSDPDPSSVDNALHDAVIAPVVSVKEVEASWKHAWRGVAVVWRRELIRFVGDRIRIVSAMVQPLMYIFVLGTGMSSMTRGAMNGMNLRTFMFPGVLTVAVLFTAVFSAVSIVWDREFGFLREMLVAPVPRSSIVVGKALGGATVATFQGSLVLVFAGLADVPYNVVMFAKLIVLMFILGFSLTGFGLVLAARITNMQTVMGLTQIILLPLMFLSGAMYPISDLPPVLSFLVKINPMTYAVHLIRRTVAGYLDLSPRARDLLSHPLTWGGWEVPLYLEILVLVVTGVVFVSMAAVQFAKAD